MLSMKTSSGIESSFSRCISSARPRFQVVSSVNTMPPISEREPAALGNLERVRRQKREVDRAKRQRDRERERQPPAPDPAHDDEDQHRVDHHRERHRDPVGAAQVVRAPEPQHEQRHRDQQRPVDERHVDLADLPLGRVLQLEPRAVAHLDRRARQRKRAGNDRLRCDHRRAGREDHERNERPLRRQQVERVLDRGGVGEQQRALSEIVDDERGHHEQRAMRGGSARRRSGPCRRRAPRSP